jgi:hypothetical protein
LNFADKRRIATPPYPLPAAGAVGDFRPTNGKISFPTLQGHLLLGSFRNMVAVEDRDQFKKAESSAV